MLIANSDRHTGNLKVDNPASPEEFFIYDHDHAIFGDCQKYGLRHLQEVRDRLGISGGVMSLGNRHCLLDVIDSWEHFHEWITRVESIPDWFIDEVCREVRGLGATAAEVQGAADFLKYRRTNLSRIICDNQSEFKGIGDRRVFL